ncbi:MAG: hypothetical protein E7649_07100 [Ruminococcaceae bacterium]|nr:hypothetical protein [Oscillospiraceae bacterium]
MTNYKRMLELVTQNGMDKKWAEMFVKKLSDDEKAFPTDEKTKEWALTKGFYPGRVELYGLTEENYKNYLPDYNYFMIHPINHHFRIWVNDKLSLKYVLNSNGCEDTMPEYYLYVENNGTYTYLMDAPSDIKRDKHFILNLLKQKGTLAVKPNSGTSGGRGFMKLEYNDGQIIENNRPITLEQFEKIVSELKNHIVTEYSYQHKDIAKIWPSSECTLRVIMVKVPSEDKFAELDWHCIVSYARFGTSVSGGASNLSSGGIGIGFDFETGKFKDFGIRYRRYCPDGIWQCTEHPDTHVVWKDASLPNWEFVKNKIKHVCSHISSLDYLGFDVIITPNGLKLCEINTHPAADYEQVMCAPILSSEKARAFFTGKNIYDIDTKKFYDAYLNSQE